MTCDDHASVVSKTSSLGTASATAVDKKGKDTTKKTVQIGEHVEIEDRLSNSAISEDGDNDK